MKQQMYYTFVDYTCVKTHVRVKRKGRMRNDMISENTCTYMCCKFLFVLFLYALTLFQYFQYSKVVFLFLHICLVSRLYESEVRIFSIMIKTRAFTR